MTDIPQITPSMFDAFAPAQIAKRVETVGVTKARMGLIQMVTLGLLAGAFIAFGAMFFTLVMTNSTLGFGVTRLLGGVVFSVGLILVVVAGAELFTGNNLLVMAWAHKLVTTGEVIRNWVVVYSANLVGSLGAVALFYWSGNLMLGDGAMGATAAKIAVAKVNLDFWPAFVRGILCNALVCLAVWLCFAAHSVTDKILAIVPPISAFVALGFEHCVANMYLIPVGILAAYDPAIAKLAGIADPAAVNLTAGGFLTNLVPVTLGNVVGGGLFVGLTYYFGYLYGRKD